MAFFDLRPAENHPSARFAHGARWLFGGAFLVAVLSTVLEGVHLTTEAHWTPSREIIMVEILVADLIIAWLFIRFSPQATSLETRPDSILFRYPGGRQRILRLSDAQLIVKLRYTAGIADKLSSGLPTYILYGRMPYQTYLTSEAFQAVRSACEEHGLEVEEKPGPRSGWTQVVITSSRS